MVKTHLKKYYSNYLAFLFILISFVLVVFYKKEYIYIYYVVAAIIFLLSFNYVFSKELGLSFKILTNKKLILFLIPTILISNLLLILINYISKDSGLPSNNNHIILGFIFFNSVRTFGEEMFFRGFLLIKDVKENNVFFWLMNVGQALIFSFIHAFIPDDLAGKIALGIYAFVISIYFGWMNRKFNSILPSWITHWLNGLQTIILFYN